MMLYLLRRVEISDASSAHIDRAHQKIVARLRRPESAQFVKADSNCVSLHMCLPMASDTTHTRQRTVVYNLLCGLQSLGKVFGIATNVLRGKV